MTGDRLLALAKHAAPGGIRRSTVAVHATRAQDGTDTRAGTELLPRGTVARRLGRFVGALELVALYPPGRPPLYAWLRADETQLEGG